MRSQDKRAGTVNLTREQTGVWGGGCGRQQPPSATQQPVSDPVFPSPAPVSTVWVGSQGGRLPGFWPLEPSVCYGDHCQLHFSPSVWGAHHLLPHLLPSNLLLTAQEGAFEKSTCVQHVSFLPKSHRLTVDTCGTRGTNHSEILCYTR